VGTTPAPTATLPEAELLEIKFEMALLPSAVPQRRKPALAPAPGPLAAAQPAGPTPKLATQKPAEPTRPQPTQEAPPEVLPSPQEPVEANASPPPALRLEQMGALEVSTLATRLGVPEWLKCRSQVAVWFRNINLWQYAPSVEENTVDGGTLLDLAQVV
jgi:hypothetical protein